MERKDLVLIFLLVIITLVGITEGEGKGVSRCWADCPDERKEVCAKDGGIYWNECQMQCIGQEKAEDPTTCKNDMATG